jgi:hypothetical protein
VSKQSEAKQQQGYVPKAVPQTCGNCAHFLSDFIRQPPAFGSPNGWEEEKNLRCGIGGFAVKKMGACMVWQAKEQS